MAAKNQASAKATAEEQKRLRLRQSQRRRDMRFKKRLKTMLSKVKRRRGERRILEKAWDKITLDCLPKSMIADHAYTLYMTEVTKLRDLYNKRRRNPGIPKLIAPIAARLLWIQSLTARITSPLEVMKHPKVRISPSLMEVQMTVNKIVTGAMRIARDLKPWGFYNANTYVDAKTLAVEAVEEKNQRRSEYHPMKSAQPERRKESEKKRSNAGHRQDESQMDELSESEVDLPPLKETSPKQFDSEGRTIITLYRAVYSNKDVVRQIVLLQGQFLIIAKEVDSILAVSNERVHLYYVRMLIFRDTANSCA
ncbi:unnamed protein product [Nesidiocoris tenuis]|uniref:Dynein heavy chain tail domain-containing protein n=1 Tax=Nesidiocoris tenuis TaxID=355587 RepID=A0A6H5G0L8_9HEMI|nr:unnamed protein product [Nesidiocoris tenuis]